MRPGSGAGAPARGPGGGAAASVLGRSTRAATRISHSTIRYKNSLYMRVLGTCTQPFAPCSEVIRAYHTIAAPPGGADTSAALVPRSSVEGVDQPTTAS
jgi:hypothetical protein